MVASIPFDIEEHDAFSVWADTDPRTPVVARLVGGENATDVSVSRTGNRLVYARSLFDTNIWRIPGRNALDKNSAPTRFIASTKLDHGPQFSPNGKKIAFISTRSGNDELWLCDRDGLNPVQLTSSDTAVVCPRWSPDSRWIAFNITKAGTYNISVISADGGPVRRLTTSASDNGLPGWSRDGRWIYFGSDRSGNWQIWKAPAQGGTAVQVTKKGGAEGFESFNGDFVYYAKYGSPGIWKVPVGGGNEIQVLEYGQPGSWALTEQGIYFGVINDAVGPTGVVSHNQQPDAIKFYSFGTARSSIVREFSRDTKISLGFPTFSVSPDDQWIVYTQVDQAGSDLMLMENYR